MRTYFVFLTCQTQPDELRFSNVVSVFQQKLRRLHHRLEGFLHFRRHKTEGRAHYCLFGCI